MGKTAIEWSDSTWNPIRGCSRVSEGCRNCFAERIAARFSGPGQPYEGLARMGENGPRWTGEVRLIESVLFQPLRWREPRRVFVNSMSDLFHESLRDNQIDWVFAVMQASPWHTFQVLTKRPERMRAYIAGAEERMANTGEELAGAMGWCHAHEHRAWPLDNIWLGVSVENQDTADERIPPLMRTPAAVRFVSCEPLLAPIDLDDWLYEPTHCRACGHHKAYYDTNPKNLPVIYECLMGVGITGEPGAPRCMACHSLEIDELNGLRWVIVGSESGPDARSMEEEWARSIKNQCALASVPFFFKQKIDARGKKVSLPLLDGTQWKQFPEVSRG